MQPHVAIAHSWILEAVASLPSTFEAGRKGFSAEHRANLAKAKLGNRNAAGAVRTDAQRARLSEVKKGNRNAAGAARKKRAGWNDASSFSFVDPDFDDEFSMHDLNTRTD
jgi:hypothetical protein